MRCGDYRYIENRCVRGGERRNAKRNDGEGQRAQEPQILKPVPSTLTTRHNSPEQRYTRDVRRRDVSPPPPHFVRRHPVSGSSNKSPRRARFEFVTNDPERTPGRLPHPRHSTQRRCLPPVHAQRTSVLKRHRRGPAAGRRLVNSNARTAHKRTDVSTQKADTPATFARASG
ncbi:hypothetical protein MRX96_039417 [Rhipicephalus microplus]